MTQSEGRPVGNASPPMPFVGGAPAAAVVDVSGTVSTDITCRKCGYNLRGLPMGGRCPECRTPVGISVQGDLLRFSDPNWLRNLRRGVNFIIAAVIVAILGGIVGALTARMMGPLLSTLISLVSGLMSLWGAWLLTERDPSGLGEDQYGKVRQLIRVTLLIALVSQFLQIIQALAPLPPAAAMLFLVVTSLAGVAGVVGQFAQLRYLSKLALRIPDMKLSARAVFLMWAFGISYGLLIVLGAIFALALAMSGPRGPTGAALVAPLGCAMGIVGVAVLVFGIMYLLMLERFGKAFRQPADISRQIWRGLEPAPTG